MRVILFLLCTGISSLSWSQLVNQGSVISTVDGQILYVDGDITNTNSATDTAYFLVNTAQDQVTATGNLNNEGGVASNLGTLTVNADFFNVDALGTEGNFSNQGDILLSGNFTNNASFFSGNPGSSVIFQNAAGINLDPDTSTFFNHVIVNGGNPVTIANDLITDSLTLNDGNVVTTASNHVLVFQDILAGSATSYIDGRLLRILRSGDYTFPIGIGTAYRPARIDGITDSTWVIMQLGQNNPSAFEESGSLRDISEDIFLAYEGDQSTFQTAGAQFIFSFDPATDVPGTWGTNYVLARADSINATFQSYGGSVLGAPLSAGLTSLQSTISLPSFGIIAVGESCEGVAPRANVAVLLEGPYNESTGTMNASRNVLLTSIFAFGGTGEQTMRSGALIPVNAVDVVDVSLRAAALPYAPVDTVKAWLLDDGSIVDFETATNSYVEFCDAVSGTDYHLQVEHMNHLPVMSATTENLNAVAAQTYDLRLANGTGIWGEGYQPVFDNSGIPTPFSAMIAGDVNDDANMVINASDYIQVIRDIRLLPVGYLESDINLNGSTEATDNDKVLTNSTFLRRSTTP